MNNPNSMNYHVVNYTLPHGKYPLDASKRTKHTTLITASPDSAWQVGKERIGKMGQGAEFVNVMQHNAGR